MVKKRSANNYQNILLIVGVVFGIVLIFSLTNYVFPKKITGYQTSDNDKMDITLEGTEPPYCPVWEKNRDSEISSVKLAWDIVDCVDRDPKDDCNEIHLYNSDNEQMDCGYGHSCCWAVCGTSLFMGDYDFSKSNKDKEADIRGALTKAKITFNAGCSYDGPTCSDGGCGTCVGGLKRETIFTILGIAGANGPFVITGGSEKHRANGEDVHTSGHHDGEKFDVRSSDAASNGPIEKVKNDNGAMSNKNFFNKYSFVKNSVDCNKDEPGEPHWDCKVTIGQVEQVLQCADGYNAYTIGD